MRRDRARLALARLALLTLAILAGPPVRAEEFRIEVKDPPVRIKAELDLTVNGAPDGTALVVIDQGDPLVAPADLERSGITVRGGRRVVIDDRELVSLRSLAPGLSFEVDERALALRITTTADLLGRRLLDLRPRSRPEELEQRFDASAFLDWAADTDLAGHYGVGLEAGGRVGRWLATTGATRAYDGLWARGLTAAVRDDVVRLERLTVGDAFTSSGPLGGAVLLGGLAFGRDLSLDPYLVQAPYPSTTALVTSPSTLEVYVNGNMVRQQAVAPGTWDLANVPAATGQTAVRAVVRDAFGREQVFDRRFYFSSGLLAPGLTDYAAAAGFVREGFGRESFSYGPPAAVARYRFGFTDWLTPGARAEASRDVVAGGGSVAVGTPYGEVDAGAGASVARGDPGLAGLLSWSWLARRYSGGLRVLAQSARYANVSLDPRADRPLVDADASAGASVTARVGVTVEVRGGTTRDLGSYGSAGAHVNVYLGAGFSLQLSADYGKAVGGPVGTQLLALLSWGRGAYGADASVARDRDGRASESVSTWRSLPRDTGVGYRVHAGGGDGSPTAVDAAVQGQTQYGRAEVAVGRAAGTTTYHALASGGVVYVDRKVWLSRATDGSFALVSAGVPGVGVTAENQLVGRTGADGTLLVPDLQPYYANRLALRDGDVPVEYDVGRTVRFIAPPLRGGAIVAFDLRRISAITGQLGVRVRGKDERPGNGELSAIVDGELRTSPITEDGRFFLERMPPGKHVIQAVWRGGSCRASVTLPEGSTVVFDAGEVRCVLDTLDPTGRIPSLRDPGYAEEPIPGAEETGAGSGGK